MTGAAEKMSGKTIVVTNYLRSTALNSEEEVVDIGSLLQQSEVYRQRQGGEVLESSFHSKKSGAAARPLSNNNFVGVPRDNGFVDAVIQAYNEHHDLLIRPDDVWIAIMTQFAMYMNAEEEGASEAIASYTLCNAVKRLCYRKRGRASQRAKLRHHFVDFEGQRELVVYQNATLGTADYGSMIDQITAKIADNLKDDSVREWAIADFSTTTDADRIASQVVLMGAMQKYFKYECRLLCGIPRITIQGTSDDWQKIKKRITRLTKYGRECKKWVAMLHPIVDEFVAIAQHPGSNGVIAQPENLQFWQTICDYRPTGSAVTYLSGWITAFCVFDSNGTWQGDQTAVCTWLGDEIENGIWPVIGSDDVPRGYVTVPVTIDDDGVRHEALLFAGHLAFSHEPIPHEASESGADVGSCLRPEVVWAIVLSNGPAVIR